MGTVIYSTSQFQAFLPTFGTIAFILVIAVFGLGSAFLNRNQRRGSRVGIGIAGGFLLVVGCVFAVLTFFTIMNGHKTVNVLLNSKTIAHDNNGNGQTTTRFVLETNRGNDLYDFNVPQNAYDKANVNTCYQITYFPRTALFSDPPTGNGSYQQVDAVTNVEIAEPSACH